MADHTTSIASKPDISGVGSRHSNTCTSWLSLTQTIANTLSHDHPMLVPSMLLPSGIDFAVGNRPEQHGRRSTHCMASGAAGHHQQSCFTHCSFLGLYGASWGNLGLPLGGLIMLCNFLFCCQPVLLCYLLQLWILLLPSACHSRRTTALMAKIALKQRLPGLLSWSA